jgi:hypothetical protein
MANLIDEIDLDEGLVTLKWVQEKTGRHPHTLSQDIRDGRLKAIKVGRGKQATWMTTRAWVTEFLLSRATF